MWRQHHHHHNQHHPIVQCGDYIITTINNIIQQSSVETASSTYPLDQYGDSIITTIINISIGPVWRQHHHHHHHQNRHCVLWINVAHGDWLKALRKDIIIIIVTNVQWFLCCLSDCNMHRVYQQPSSFCLGYTRLSRNLHRHLLSVPLMSTCRKGPCCLTWYLILCRSLALRISSEQ